MKRFLSGGILGGLVAFLFDPEGGRRRRAVARDRTGAFFRGLGRQSARTARGVSSSAYGVKQKVTHRGEEEKPQPNDATLARKVESEIFRDPEVPKGKIDVNAENGVVFLRGEADRPELIEDLEAQVKKIPGVQGVQNLLHLPGEPAPNAPAGSHNG
jgi:osmotically-inducible protein OsmY